MGCLKDDQSYFFQIDIAIWRCSQIQRGAYMDTRWLEYVFKLHTIYGYWCAKQFLNPIDNRLWKGLCTFLLGGGSLG